MHIIAPSPTPHPSPTRGEGVTSTIHNSPLTIHHAQRAFSSTPSSSGLSRGFLRKGFSLVELSIVLVILGLLTGGILAGQSLIRAAELRSITADYHRFTAAIQTFRDKYMAIPGDMRNAVAFWGATDGTTGETAACRSTASTSAATCNGNGNGSIDITLAYSHESYRFWQHLANAGLIEGSYVGIAPSPAANDMDSVPGVNVPRGRISSTGWTIYWQGTTGGDPATSTYTLPEGYGNSYTFGSSTGSTVTRAPTLKPEEAWNIDTKMDDGKPAYGKIIAQFYNNQCAYANNGAPSTTNRDASYNVSDNTIRCSLIFRQQF